MSVESVFGHWDVEHGVPVFRETLHPDDPACRWDPIVAARTDRHWCAIGNRRLQVVVDNLGTTAIRDTAFGFRWLTTSAAGTGATVVTDAGGARWATDRDRWPNSWSAPHAPVRTWGPTWATLVGEHEGLRVERTVACPEGEAAFVLVRVVVSSATGRSIDLSEEWRFAGDEAVRLISQEPVSVETGEVGDDGCRLVRLTRDVVLRPNEPVTWWLRVGLINDGQTEPASPDAVWAASLDALRHRLPTAACVEADALAHEVPWHAALLTGGACVDAVLGGHTLDQGSAYSFDLGFNGAARDPLQHALPLVYSEPDLALSVLRNTCTWAGPDGALPYALDGKKNAITDWFEPSDQGLWSMWLAAEYAAATGDLAAFGAPVPFHPSHHADAVPLVDHLIGHFRHLVDVVGVGAHGHIRILNADWNDSALTLAPIERTLMQAEGESVLNSAMAAWVLPRFAGLLRRLGGDRAETIAAEADARAEGWRALVADEWNGRWYRRAYGPGAVVGDDDLWLEVQPWAILCGAVDADRARELLATIDAVVRRDSPLGARLRGPLPIRVPEGRIAGEGSAGGVWFSINMTLAWAAASLDPAYAWDELRRMTLAAHTAAYPAIWEGTISGPDAYNTPESPRPGHTWAWPDRGIGMQSFPVNNLHAHSQVLLTYLRLLGVEPTSDGALRVGRGGEFSSATFRLATDGHGSLDAIGPVSIASAHGDASGTGRMAW